MSLGRIRKTLSIVLLLTLGLSSSPAVETVAQSPSPDVADIQWRLVERGFDPGAIDGQMGPRSRAALRAFQTEQGLPVTGVPDEETLRALFGDVPLGAGGVPGTPAPPAMEAVPLRPVEVAPLTPLFRESPHEGLVAAAPGVEGADRAPAAADDGVRPSDRQPETVPEASPPPEPLFEWRVWAAALLAIFVILGVFAASRRGATGRRADSEEEAPPVTPEPPVPDKTAQGHVFGVTVPPPLRGAED